MAIKKGVVLAGGTGSRMFPLTKVTNKHLLPVGKKPMIIHQIDKMVGIGIVNILVVTGVEHMGAVVGLLGSGKDYDCSITYRVQDEAGGIGQALYLAKDFVGKDNCLVILGDNIFEDTLVGKLDSFEKGAQLFLHEVEDPERFGVPTLDGDKIVKIIEKPEKPESNYAVTGIYAYDATVFEFIDKCAPSSRGEMEITDVNNHYIDSKACNYDILDGWWTDAGTFESYALANELVNKR